MLSLAGARVLGWRPSASGARKYSTQTPSKPVLFWQHSHASTTSQYTAPLPEASRGVSSELIAKMRRLRAEAPKTFTAKRLSSNFHLSRATVNAVAPYHHPATKTKNLEKAARRAKIVPEDPQVKKERLSNWWNKQYNSIAKHRQRRHLYHVRGCRMMAEVDFNLIKESDNRDYHADMLAENARNRKRKALAANRRRK